MTKGRETKVLAIVLGGGFFLFGLEESGVALADSSSIVFFWVPTLCRGGILILLCVFKVEDPNTGLAFPRRHRRPGRLAGDSVDALRRAGLAAWLQAGSVVAPESVVGPPIPPSRRSGGDGRRDRRSRSGPGAVPLKRNGQRAKNILVTS